MTQIGLANFNRHHDYLVGIDSDGCAFDTMEIKHKECFIPNFIRCMGLQPVARFAREACEFANLYSRTRGANRFPAYLKALDLLAARPEVRARGVSVPRLSGVREWLERETKLGTRTVCPEADRTGDPDLKLACEWSRAVDESIAQTVRAIPPFPGVRTALERLSTDADLIVCSATPNEALLAEWTEHALAALVQAICGQESGSKAESLRACSEHGYDLSRMLMVGDSPGDMRAAKTVGCLYYPILPGDEESSWQRFNDESLAKFFDGSYEGEYEAALIAEFEACLPAEPLWKTD